MIMLLFQQGVRLITYSGLNCVFNIINYGITMRKNLIVTAGHIVTKDV